MKIKKIIIAVICSLIAVWVAIGVVDYSRLHRFKEPIFCLVTSTCDCGGCGKYVGLGYSYDFEGDFMPDAVEDDLEGITKWTYYLFGLELQTRTRV